MPNPRPWARAQFFLLALLGGDCTVHEGYVGPLAVLPSPIPRVELPIRDPLVKPDLSVFGSARGPGGREAGLWFTVDSGWTGVDLPRDIGALLELKELGQAPVITALGKSEAVRVSSASALVFGNLVATRVLVGLQTDRGVLGQAILQHAPWEVSWDRGVLTLGAAPWTSGQELESVPLVGGRQHGEDEVEVSLNGRLVRLILDTGAAISALPAEVARALALEVHPFSAAITTGGGMARITQRAVGVLTLGGKDLGPKGFAVLPSSGHRGLLGLDILSLFNFQIVPGARLLLLPRRNLRDTARERVNRWPWMPRICKSVGCVRATLRPGEPSGQLEVQQEARLTNPAQWVLACADPQVAPPTATLDTVMTGGGKIQLPLQRIILSLPPGGPRLITLPVSLARRLWFAANGAGCQELETLDALPIPANEVGNGPGLARISP